MGLNLVYDEGQTPIDENEIHGLKIKTISTQSELDEFEQLNIEKAVAWSMESRFKKEKILTEKFIKNLHKKMFGEVWKWAGEFRKTEKNLGIEWNRIGLEVKKLIDDSNYWIENEIYSPVEIALRFKHRIVSIHCFPNGNGRHSRMLADIIIDSIFKEKLFTWHQSNMVKPDKTRQKYIQSLKEADKGNIKPLIQFALN